MSYVTPIDLPLEAGTYEVEFPAEIVLNDKPHRFSIWDDESINPIRTIILNQDKDIEANYMEVTEITELIVSGTVTEQMAEGETVTITITKPDLTEETLTALTDALKAFSATKELVVAGLYKFKARIEADAGYESAESPTAEYAVDLAARSITINVGSA